MTELPKGWVWTEIGDLRLDKSRAVNPASSPDKRFELYSVPSLVSGKPELVHGKDVGSNKQTVQEGTVLLCKINPRINRVWLVHEKCHHDQIASTEWIPFFEIPGLLPNYLLYFMQNSQFRHFLTLHVSGVGGSLMRVNPSKFVHYPFPLPPLPEQRRIVAKIEELFTRLDAGVEALKKVKLQLKRYRQSVLKSAFEGKLTQAWRESHKDELEPASVLLERIRQERKKQGKYKELPPLDTSELPGLPEGWAWTKGSTLFPFITSGSRGWARYYSQSGPTFLRIGNLNHDSISLDMNNIQRVCPPKGEEGSRTRVTGGDILISITADLGMVAMVPEGFEEAYINQHIALARPSPEINPNYVAWSIVSPSGGPMQFLKLQRGATKIGLGLDDIRAIIVPLPSLAEQRQIVAEIERLFSIADEVEATIDQSLAQSDRLRQSILKRAFEGKLVPQDPKDEPADMLLERIRAERASVGAPLCGRPPLRGRPGHDNDGGQAHQPSPAGDGRRPQTDARAGQRQRLAK